MMFLHVKYTEDFSRQIYNMRTDTFSDNKQLSFEDIEYLHMYIVVLIPYSSSHGQSSYHFLSMLILFL